MAGLVLNGWRHATARMDRFEGHVYRLVGCQADFRGPVEVDDTYMGGKEKNKHAIKSRQPAAEP